MFYFTIFKYEVGCIWLETSVFFSKNLHLSIFRTQNYSWTKGNITSKLQLNQFRVSEEVENKQ